MKKKNTMLPVIIFWAVLNFNEYKTLIIRIYIYIYKGKPTKRSSLFLGHLIDALK